MMVLEIDKADVLIDDDDWIRVNQFTWKLKNFNARYYVIRNVNCQQIKLGNFILQITNNLIVDHKNCNTLDYQRSNLRQANRIQNGANRGKGSNNTSGYKGVSWDKNSNSYKVMIGYYGKLLYIMRTKDPIIGAKAYDTKAKELFGEFARLNFPGE